MQSGRYNPWATLTKLVSVYRLSYRRNEVSLSVDRNECVLRRCKIFCSRETCQFCPARGASTSGLSSWKLKTNRHKHIGKLNLLHDADGLVCQVHYHWFASAKPELCIRESTKASVESERRVQKALQNYDLLRSFEFESHLHAGLYIWNKFTPRQMKGSKIIWTYILECNDICMIHGLKICDEFVVFFLKIAAALAILKATRARK